MSLKQRVIKSCLLIFIGTVLGWSVTGATTISDLESHRQVQMEERIEPVGEVRVKADIQTAASSAESGPRSGESIYQTFCLACHTTGAAGAPKLGDKGDWQPRVAKGLEQLLKNAVNGINAMPPKGTCMDCSDDEIKASVEYMLEAVQ